MELHLEMGELYSVNIETQLYNDEAAAKTWFPSHTGHIPNAQKLCVPSGCCPGQQRHAPFPPAPSFSPTDNSGQERPRRRYGEVTETGKYFEVGMTAFAHTLEVE